MCISFILYRTIEGNKFTGTIPKEIALLNLKELYYKAHNVRLIGNNRFSGTIPKEIGTMSRLLAL